MNHSSKLNKLILFQEHEIILINLIWEHEIIQRNNQGLLFTFYCKGSCSLMESEQIYN